MLKINNLESFGKWFENKPYTKETYPSIMITTACDLTNEFIEKYITKTYIC